jgi:hypothetical protein
MNTPFLLTSYCCEMCWYVHGAQFCLWYDMTELCIVALWIRERLVSVFYLFRGLFCFVFSVVRVFFGALNVCTFSPNFFSVLFPLFGALPCMLLFSLNVSKYQMFTINLVSLLIVHILHY